jgi:hypothetical protein
VNDKLIERIKNTVQDGNLNFLLGSGLSRPFLATLGNIESLLTECDETSMDDQVRKIVHASIYRHYFVEVIQKNLQIRDSDASASDVLGEYKKFLKTWNSILLLRRNTLLSKEINLFTTNIDIFLEMASEDLSLEFNDGFNGRFQPTFSPSNFKQSRFKKGLFYDKTSEIPVFNLVKLHGSLSWEHNKDSILFSHELTHVKSVADALAASAALIDVPDKATLSGLIKLAGSVTAHPSIDAFMAAYEELLIVINPTKEKFRSTLRNHIYYDLLRMFSNELEKENSVLFVMGFSFADEHIREITLRAANSNPTLIIYVLAHSSDAEKELQGRLDAANCRNRNIEIIAPDQKEDSPGSFVDSFSYDFTAINSRFLDPLLSRCGTRQDLGAKASV